MSTKIIKSRDRLYILLKTEELYVILIIKFRRGGKMERLIELINASSDIVIFGGAGLSTESGIPDFRGSGGLYTAKGAGVPPEKILHISYLKRHPCEFFEYYKTNMLYPNAKPNEAHLAFAKLEKMGKVSAVITQNIDGLHSMAGSLNVIELHGTTLSSCCMGCGEKFDTDAIARASGIPRCNICGGIIRPDIVLYGEHLDSRKWASAANAVSNADALIVCGTSLTVHPAADLVSYYRGRHLVIINKTPTPYDAYAELIIREPVGEVFGKIIKKIKQ